MAWTGIPHVVLHVLCSTRTSGRCFRFQSQFWQKKPFWVKIAHYSYPYNFFKIDFLKIFSRAEFVLLESGSAHLCIIYAKQKKHPWNIFLGLTFLIHVVQTKWIDKKDGKLVSKILFLFLFWSCVTFGFTARHTRGCFSTWKIWHRRFFSIHHSKMKEWCKTHDIH